MTSPAVREHQSPLEAALRDVHTTLAQLLVAADEQYDAVVDHDRERIESVTRQQERLSAQLARAETRRQEVLAGVSLDEAIAALSPREAARADTVRQAIASGVRQLQSQHTRTADLLAQSIQLTNQTLTFLHRLVAPTAPSYGARGMAVTQRSMLVDSRA
jgi:flagellar biosynthesis/type III secretory pathway chaperone